MKIEVSENPFELSQEVRLRFSIQDIMRLTIMRILEKFEDRGAHILAREYLKRKGHSIRKVADYEFVDQRVRRMVKEIVSRCEK